MLDGFAARAYRAGAGQATKGVYQENRWILIAQKRAAVCSATDTFASLGFTSVVEDRVTQSMSGDWQSIRKLSQSRVLPHYHGKAPR